MNDDDKQPKAAGDKPRTKEVTLKKEHRHRGILHQPGDKIDVRPDQEERLRKNGEI